MQPLRYTGSVTGYAGIDAARPAIDSAGKRLNLFEALRPQPHGDAQRAGPVVADHDDRLIRIEFRVRPAGDIPHRHKQGVVEMGGLKLPCFTDIQQERRVRLLQLLSEGLRVDLWIEHPIRIRPPCLLGMESPAPGVQRV